MRKFEVTGMTCAACSARVEKAVSSLEGVSECNVSLLTNTLTVEGSATENEIADAVLKAGYGLKSHTQKNDSDDFFVDRETPILKRRFFSSLIFLAILMYISMGHAMWGLPLPAFFEDSPIAIGLAQLLLAEIVMIINKKFFVSGFRAVINRAPNMDTLVALGSGASFVYSTAVVFLMAKQGTSQQLLHQLYFESAAMILVLITIGKMLEAKAKGKTTNALKSLVNLAPKTAVIIVNSQEKTVAASEIKKGDIFAVKPGEAIPADGVIVEGHSAVNESALTGESIPVDKSLADGVSAGTVNVSGYIKCEATKVGEDTLLSQIIKMVSDAATKAPVEKVANKVSGIFVPTVLAVSVITFIVWFLIGKDIGFVLARAISVLVISCPCALGLATPVAVMVGSGMGAKNGILFKTAQSLEMAGKTDVVVLDKTGTITKGEPEVTDIIPLGCEEEELLEFAYSLEIKSEHPLAKAIVKEAEKRKILAVNTEKFEILPGNGIVCEINGEMAFAGNFKFVSGKAEIPTEITEKAEKLSESGKTPLFFAVNNSLKGIIAVADTIKDDSPEAIAKLKKMGIKTVMLTGDNERTAKAIAKLSGVDEVIADLMPADKEKAVRRLKNEGIVMMVGDGINDAPALTSADVGAAIGAGTDVAIDAADVVLMKSSLSDVATVVRLSRATLRNIKQNLFWAFIYNVVGIPLAAGVWIPIFGWQLSPMFGAAAMSLSSFCVVTNALRLNFANLQSGKYDKKRKVKGRKIMEKSMKIEGMMCMHCEARVKKCLEAIDGVTEAVVSHETDSAIVKMTKDIDFGVLKAVVEEQGYNVID